MMLPVIKRKCLCRTVFVLYSVLGLFVGANVDELYITSANPNAVAEKEFNLTCKSESKVSDLSWYRNTERILIFNPQCTSTNTTTKSLRYQFGCKDMTIFTLVIPANVISEEDGANWQCSSSRQSNIFTINVLHEPKGNLTLTGYNGSILGLEQILTFYCYSYGGRPWAVLSWICASKQFKGMNYNTSEDTTSVLSLNLNKNLSGQICKCFATHKLWDTPLEISSLPLQVYYASADDPHITGYNYADGVREGERINLTCTVYGGYPLPSLFLACDDTTIDVSDIKDRSTEDVATILLPLFVNRTISGRQCVCNGISSANYNRTSNVTFTVNYPPSVTLIYHKEQLPNGTKYNIYCQVDKGHPESYIISWSQTFANKVVRINTDLHEFQSNNGHNLTFIAYSHNDLGLYTCSVQNNVTDLHGNLLQNKSVFISSNYPKQQTNMPLIIVTSLVGVLCLAIVTVVIICVVMKHKSRKESIHLTNEISMAKITPYAATGNEPELDSAPVNKTYADVTTESQDIGQTDAIDLNKSEEDEKNGLNYVEIDTSKTSSQNIGILNSKRSEVEYADIRVVA